MEKPKYYYFTTRMTPKIRKALIKEAKVKAVPIYLLLENILKSTLGV